MQFPLEATPLEHSAVTSFLSWMFNIHRPKDYDLCFKNDQIEIRPTSANANAIPHDEIQLLWKLFRGAP